MRTGVVRDRPLTVAYASRFVAASETEEQGGAGDGKRQRFGLDHPP